MRTNSVAAGLRAIAGTNFFSTFTPVFFCSFAAFLISRRDPVFARQAHNVLFVAALYTFPLLFTGTLAHYLSTRFSFRNVVMFSRAIEVLAALLGVVALLLFPYLGRIPLLLVVLALGAIYSIYRPALKSYTSEKVAPEYLSRAAGITEGCTFFGIAAGVVVAVVAYNLVNAFRESLIPVGLLATASAFSALLISMRLEPGVPLHPRVHFSELPRQWLDTLREQPRYRELVLTGIGENYIFASIILVASLAIEYIDIHIAPAMRSQFHQYSIMASPVLGAGVGALVGGWISRRNVELGIVPPAVVAMVVISLLIGGVPLYADSFVESGLLAVLLALFGFFAGVMLVPVQANQEFFVRPVLRPAFFGWFYLPFGVGILLAIALSSLVYALDVSIFTFTTLLAALTVALAAMTFYLMPQFLLRFLMRILLRTFYRLRCFNCERIPVEGPALLVANRASFVDMLFISACTSRPIRFLMHESYFRVPILYHLYKSVGFIEVPAGARPKKLQRLFETTRELLRRGELICVFPEDDITRNGVMSGFRNGVSAMLPEDVEVPVIPVRIGMTWGSIFSCFYGKFKLTWPNELPHPASVTVGKPIPRDSSAYELRIYLSELAAENELIPSPEERPFHTQIAFLARRFPFRSCVGEYAGDGFRMPSNFSLLIRAILINRFLRRLCAGDGEYIGVMLPNGVDFVAVMTGILMADRHPAVFNYTASREANRQAIEKTGIRHIITSRAFVEKIKFPEIPELIYLEDAQPKIDRPVPKVLWTLAALLLPTGELMKLVSPLTWNDVHQTAVVLFSSGSTGVPKGVMLTHHNITADVFSVSLAIDWRKSDRILGNLPLFHSFGMAVCLWLPVFTAAKSCFIPNALDATSAGTVLRDWQVTVLVATPAFIQLYMRRCDAEVFDTVRLTFTGAEKLRDDVARRYFELTGLAIVEGYGCTELSPVVSINLANTRLEFGAAVKEPGSIGPPLTGICAKVVDPSTFALMPEDTDGLLIVKGAVVMKGYLGEPERTAEVIRDGWYITGDIAKMNRSGFITITGRVSRFSKIGGEMVPHELVERELNEILLSDERLIAVCGGEDQKRGEKLLVFYIDPERVEPEQLVKKLRERGIPNLWIPKVENFILVDELPLLGSGKLDLARLAKLAEHFCRTGSVAGV